MVPTLVRALGIKGERLMVGTNDNKDSTYLFGAMNVVDGVLTTRQLPLPRRKGQRVGAIKTKLLQATFVKHLDAIARRYPSSQHPRVITIVDNAPWHGGQPVRDALRRHKHLELYRLPSYSPQLNPIERFWKLLRRRATHNRHFEQLPTLRRSISRSIQYYQTMRHRTVTLVANPFGTESLVT